MAGAGGEEGLPGQCPQCRIAAGAAAPNGDPLSVGPTLGNQIAGSVDTVHDIDNPPTALQALAIVATVAGAAAIVNIDYAKAAAGPELNL